MQLEHSFTVPVGVERAWEVLLDVERIAPCMPGAALDTVDGDAFTGTVKVRLGPIGLTYKGKAAFVEKDAAAHRAVIDAQGRDARGNGTAKATVTATLAADGASATTVVVTTDLAITGRPAQFGRSVMTDVGSKLIGQFADCLAGTLSAEPAASTPPLPADPTGDGDAVGDTAGTTGTAASPEVDPPAEDPSPVDLPAVDPAPAPTAAAGPTARAAVHRVVTPARAPEPIDLMASAGPAVARRLVPFAGVGLVAAVVGFLLGRRLGGASGGRVGTTAS